MMTKGLAYIGEIKYVTPIPDADRIEQVTVVCGSGGIWTGVVRRGDFSVGDLCETYLQDALLPVEPRFEFMAKSKFRIKIQRLRGAISECLVMPLTVDGSVGDDITEQMGVTKYSKPLPKSVGGDIANHFPAFIPKTDEPNFQKVSHLVDWLQGRPYYITQKIDGSSGTAYWNDGHFGVCSRNYELKLEEPDDAGKYANIRNAIQYVAMQKYGLDKALEGKNYAVQFEVYGQGIQKNPLGISGYDLAAFNIYDIRDRRYVDMSKFYSFCDVYTIPTVPIVEHGTGFNYSFDDLRDIASQQVYPNGRAAEGIVVRSEYEQLIRGERVSFKVINPDYKD
jgi:RNA ligase (TIGR02306 family)